MKKLSVTIIAFLCFTQLAEAQKTAQIKTVLDAEKDYNHVLAQKGIRDGSLSVVDADAMVFKPEPILAKTYYTGTEKSAGKLTVTPTIARISANGDLAFSAGSYIIKNTNDDADYGEYLSIWRTDLSGKLKMIFNIDMQHPETKETPIVDFKEPDIAASKTVNKDPFTGKNIIITTDKLFNSSLNFSSVSAYKEFLTLDGRYFFPGFEPVIGQDKILQFVSNQAISIEALNTGAGRAVSSDLAYSYGKATIKKGEVSNKYNYIRIWEPDSKHKWNILTEIFSPADEK
ncbi:MAG: hypothetical protein EOP42_04970 [Sphingobacteriaceae bacterium]|nr:MAG: hypothetical protein EOP42_04970 [Sphingobacteriaceae bacterium]